MIYQGRMIKLPRKDNQLSVIQDAHRSLPQPETHADGAAPRLASPRSRPLPPPSARARPAVLSPGLLTRTRQPGPLHGAGTAAGRPRSATGARRYQFDRAAAVSARLLSLRTSGDLALLARASALAPNEHSVCFVESFRQFCFPREWGGAGGVSPRVGSGVPAARERVLPPIAAARSARWHAWLWKEQRVRVRVGVSRR